MSALYILNKPVNPRIEAFACAARKRERDHARVERFDAALKEIHLEGDVRQEINLVDDQRVHTAIHDGIFIRLVVALRDGGDQHGLMSAEAEIGGAYQV